MRVRVRVREDGWGRIQMRVQIIRQHERNSKATVLLNIQCEAINDAGQKSNHDMAGRQVKHEQRLTALSTPQQKPYDSASLIVTSPLVTWNSNDSG